MTRQQQREPAARMRALPGRFADRLSRWIRSPAPLARAGGRRPTMI